MAQKRALVGLDIAKGKVDAAIRSAAAATFVNSPEGHRQLLAWLKAHGVGKAVMEASGGYERSWAELLAEAGLEVVIVDPKRVRHFAKSAGQLAKNDPIDARMIAWFGEVFADTTRGKPRDEDRQDLDRLVTARQGLKRLQTQIQSWGEHEQPKIVQQIHQALLRTLAVQLRRLEKVIITKLKNTPQFAPRAEIIESVPGLGDTATAGLIALLPELGYVDRQAATALLGAAPFDDDSGERHGQRHIMGGRKKLRNLLYMAVLGAATQHNPVLKAYYQRLLARGKEPKVALMACMRKLIGILTVMLARGEKWDASKHALA